VRSAGTRRARTRTLVEIEAEWAAEYIAAGSTGRGFVNSPLGLEHGKKSGQGQLCE
jgi:hypothetical protein